jgi:hypothetical protein
MTGRVHLIAKLATAVCSFAAAIGTSASSASADWSYWNLDDASTRVALELGPQALLPTQGALDASLEAIGSVPAFATRETTVMVRRQAGATQIRVRRSARWGVGPRRYALAERSLRISATADGLPGVFPGCKEDPGDVVGPVALGPYNAYHYTSFKFDDSEKCAGYRWRYGNLTYWTDADEPTLAAFATVGAGPANAPRDDRRLMDTAKPLSASIRPAGFFVLIRGARLIKLAGRPRGWRNAKRPGGKIRWTRWNSTKAIGEGTVWSGNVSGGRIRWGRAVPVLITARGGDENLFTRIDLSDRTKRLNPTANGRKWSKAYRLTHVTGAWCADAPIIGRYGWTDWGCNKRGWRWDFWTDRVAGAN